MRSETIIPIFFLSLAIYFLYLAFQLPSTPWVTVGPQVWPAILLVGIIFSCVGIIYSNIVKKEYVIPEKIDREGLIRLIGTSVFIFSYIVLIDIIGFIFDTLILSSIYLYFMRVKLWVSVILGILFTIFALLLFPVVLTALLPRGQGIFYDLTSYILSIFGR
jgi:H+/Cl- antiporter ClcA